MSRYAADTSVSCETSRAEIERTLGRYGATTFMYGTSQTNAVIGFEAWNRQVRFYLPLPERDLPEFTLTPSKKWTRSEQDAFKAWEQACRQRWRALALCIKAKFEAVECGITTFEQEFLAHIMMPGGQTVGEEVIPRVELAYATGKPVALLPAPMERKR